MKRKLLSIALVLAMALGLAVPALAAGPTFTDVPENHWAYADVEAAAAAGVMNGTGGGMFSPDVKVSVAQFLTLVGRVVFPDTIVSETDSWYGPYVRACQVHGLLTGTQVDVTNVEAEISRYDMAVILRAAAKKLGMTETLAKQSQVKDYGMVPTMYADAVLAVYGMGLIKGDGVGNFNGSNTMARSEVATVIMRLKKVVPGDNTTVDPEQSSETTQPENPEQPGENAIPQIVTARVWHSLYYYPTQGEASWYGDTKLVGPGVPFKIFYTEDNGETSTLIAESKTEGTGQFALEFPLDKTLLSNPDGQFYISAQFEKDGKTFVTQDLRTDGRKALSLVCVFEKGNGVGGGQIELVPPTGQRWEFDLKGYVPKSAEATGDGPFEMHYFSPEGFTVQLVYYPDPKLQDGVPIGEKVILGEATANENGSFVMSVSVDTLDCSDQLKNYRIEAHGVYDGKNHFSWERDALRTLGEIKAEPIDAAWGIHMEYDR